ncbi:MAG: holin [Breznakia sp.]
MKYLKSKKWWGAALTRAIRTAAQAFVGLISVGVVISDVDWFYVVSATAMASIVSIATSLSGLPEVEGE